MTGTCNGLLDSDLRGGDLGRYKFLATVRVQNTDNTGNTGNEAEVRAEFELLGTEPLRNVERATVEVGDTAAVHFNGNIDRDAWLRFADAGRSCDVGAEIVDVFGEIGG